MALVKSDQLEMNPNVEISMKWGTILRLPASEEPQEEMFLYLFDNLIYRIMHINIIRKIRRVQW